MSFCKKYLFNNKLAPRNLNFFQRFLKMTWRAVGVNNADLIEKLKECGIVATESVAAAMTATDRKYYAPSNPYMDAPQGIGYGVTISAPHMHAFALEYLRDHLKPGCHVLDVGSGSGYLTACFYRYMQAQGENSNTKVVGIEHQPQLFIFSRKNLNNDDAQMLKSEKLIIVEGDGRKGFPEYAPYNAIHVGAAAPEKPSILIQQLAKGGRLIVPVGPELGQQYMMQYDKDKDGRVSETRLVGVMYVPLTDLRRN
ncbi:protein-L-isoaspartate(D-aspartate) O-methyltransferase-like [Lucilia cuprina]|uniref:protein-L-isoaspartate(D-aspartate) O-methyltransferase-like n=1 Tax=Lucilia cuprina TaxID=7375 RepID=UPI001F06D9C8|nr:protein-L-isoaspartate(D-aspartate) O-methyltransferase-like [Lucilia cuprina]